MTVEDGLSQGYISLILEDREGFLWIGTKNGLNRYDGRQFKIFSPNPVDSLSISQNWITSIKEFDHFLALGFSRGGINIFDKETYHSFSLRVKGDKQNFLSGTSANVTYIDPEGNMIVYVDKREYYQLIKISFPEGWPRNPEKAEIRVKYEILQTVKNPQDFRVNLLNGNSWFINETSNQLEFTALKTGETKTYAFPADFNAKELITWNVVGDDNIWFSTPYVIYRFIGNGWQTTRVDVRAGYILQRPGDELVLLKKYDGFLVFNQNDFKGGYLKNQKATGFIPTASRNIISVFRDRSGIFWLGTGGYGIIKVDPKLQYFKSYFLGNSIRTPVFLNFKGAPFISTTDSVDIDAFFDQNKAIAARYNAIEYAAADPWGNYWAWVKTREGKSAFLKRNASGIWEDVIEAEFTANAGPSFFRISEEGTIWLVNRDVLIQFDPVTRLFTSYSFKDLIVRDYTVFDLQRTANGMWWIATDCGLIKAIPNKAGYDFQVLTAANHQKNGLGGNEILALLPDPRNTNILWIGTRGGGLDRLNVTTMLFTHLTTNQGLPNDVVYGILPDDSGNLWLSSNKGIIKYDPISGDIGNYTVSDGIPNNEFNTWASAIRSDGTLFFGGVNGLVGINPKDIRKNPVTPMVRITGLMVNNQFVRYGDATGILSKTLPFTHQITLPFSKNSITLEMAALEFTVPSKNIFKYYLKGAEKEWAHETTDNKASYLNLQPGNYTFLIKAANSDSEWNETPVALQITILPPWYLAWWAKLIYTLLATAVILGIFRFFLNRQKLQHKLILEHKEAERLKELDEIKNHLYTNITHEFRTPLTLIQGMAEEVIHLEGKSSVKLKNAGKLIKRNGAKLLQLINQLLDLAKLEGKSFTLNPSPTELVGFLRYLTHSFQSYGAARNITVSFYSRQERLVMLADQDRLGTILSNLLSNAIKFSHPGGKIVVGFQVLPHWNDFQEDLHFIALEPLEKHSGEWAAIYIKDKGPGIELSSMPHIFNRFYQVQKNKEFALNSTGIGLALVKELVQLMEGGLAVRSEVNVETEFVVVLPIVIPKGMPFQEVKPSFLDEAASASNQEVVIERSAPKGLNQTLPTMLLIEDNADILGYLISSNKDDFNILTAADGEEGIEKALASMPDIIVMDIMMPNVNGMEALKVLKQDDRTKHIPIIILTAKANNKDKLNALKKGADDYLLKPFSAEELRIRAANLIENYRKRRGFTTDSFPKSKVADAVTIRHQDWLEMLENLCMTAIDRKIDLNSSYLADQMALSERHLLRRLKHLTGMTTNQYVLELKLKMAAQLLSTKTHLTISEIAYMCGFNTPNYFAKVFQARFSKRPSEFLEEHS